MPRQFFLLFACLGLGELIVWSTGIALPSSIIGMLLLTAFLQLGWIKLAWVQRLSDFLIAHMGLFFVPPGVSLMLHLKLLQAELLPIAVATVGSTILVLVVTGHTHQLVIWLQRRWMARKNK